MRPTVTNLVSEPGCQDSEMWVLYSTCDEDANSELDALNVNTEDTVLCVTGSGCRTLSLLARQPQSITSVDYAAGQNYLLELKLAAFRQLSHKQVLAFLGVTDSNDRWDAFTHIEAELSDNARQYFRRYRKAIEKGVIFQGRHEKFYANILSPFLHILYGKDLKRIFATDSLEEQREIYFNRIRGPFWRFMITKGFSKGLLTTILNNPNYEVEIDVPHLGQYILDTLDHTFSNHLAKDNDWLSVMFNGRYVNPNAVPHYLKKQSYEAIRASKSEIKIVTADLVDFISSSRDNLYSKFSLSDVSSCIAKDRFESLISEIPRIGVNEARLCYRNFFARHSIPESMNGLMQRDDKLCEKLNHSDMAFSYEFEIATLRLG